MRAPTTATTCTGTTPTGALLTYVNEGRLTAWQNIALVTTTPTSTPALEEALYDGEGQRVQQIDASNTTHTTTQHTYVGGTEDLASQWANTGGTVTSTTTAYYGGVAQSVNGALSYTLSDGLGSVSESVSASTGTVSAAQLYGPYGAARYTSGTLPTDYAFTHQRADATSGLDYYGARYYDPVAGQFSSADTTLAGGLNRYGYVGGNPETLVDPSGHAEVNSGAMLTRGLTEEQTTLFLAGLAAIFAAGVKAVQDWQAIQPAPPIATSPRWARHQSNTMAAWNASVPGSSNAINRGGWIADGYSGSSASSGAQPSRSADVTTTETAAGTAPESEPQPADSGRGARQGGGGRWLYHGTRAKFDRFDVSAAIANQAGRTLELGPGIYLTDDPARAYEYAGGDKRIAFIYRAWVPDALLAQFPTSIISTNTSPQWVITHQADAEVLNETIQRITAIDWWLRNPWRNEP